MGGGRRRGGRGKGGVGGELVFYFFLIKWNLMVDEFWRLFVYWVVFIEILIFLSFIFLFLKVGLYFYILCL